MPIIAHITPLRATDFQDQPKTHPGLRFTRKTEIWDSFISSDFENKADLGLFLNGAQYGLLFDLKTGDRGPDWARIRVEP